MNPDGFRWELQKKAFRFGTLFLCI